jgi:anti-sigma B factor antagonist
MQAGEGFDIAQLGVDVYMVAARGELDVATAPALREALDTARTRGARRLIADLAAVTFLDSAGLGVLVTSAKRLRMDDGEFVVVSDDPRIIAVVRVERSLVEAVSELVGRPAAV